MVHDEVPPYCRACEDFHEESTCPIFCQINDQGIPESSNNYVGHFRNQDSINAVGTVYPISNENWKKVKEHSQEVDNATKIFGEKPTPEQINEYDQVQRGNLSKKMNIGQSKQCQYIPRSVSYPKPHPNVDLNVDLGGWIANAKILVPISELIKIPGQRDKLMKAIDVPAEKETVKPSQKEHEDN